MEFNTLFFINSILLGIGLSMDAFSVSLVNGLNEPKMKFSRSAKIAGVYAFFQAFMPMSGWFCVHTVIHLFSKIAKYMTLVGAILLAIIGIKMIIEAFTIKEDNDDDSKLSMSLIFVQGIATSIDALSVGFTIGKYNFFMALVASLIIAAITEIICIAGLEIGKKAGTKLSSKATIIGGVILILISLEFFLRYFR